jgi:hypothetical protein
MTTKEKRYLITEEQLSILLDVVEDQNTRTMLMEIEVDQYVGKSPNPIEDDVELVPKKMGARKRGHDGFMG